MSNKDFRAAIRQGFKTSSEEMACLIGKPLSFVLAGAGTASVLVGALSAIAAWWLLRAIGRKVAWPFKKIGAMVWFYVKVIGGVTAAIFAWNNHDLIIAGIVWLALVAAEAVAIAWTFCWCWA